MKPLSRGLGAFSTVGILLLIYLGLTALTKTPPAVWIAAVALWIGPAIGIYFAERQRGSALPDLCRRVEFRIWHTSPGRQPKRRWTVNRSSR